MAYTIYNTDGSVLLTLGEGKVDQKTTSLTLIGKNVNSYGEYLNNNLVSLLGNYAGTNEPRSPVVGQLWYDTAAGRMKVYDLNNLFRPITNTIAGDEQPVELAPNDFWWDTKNEQIKFTPDGTTLYVVGPTDSVTFGTTGWVAESINDNSGNPHTVTSLYNGGDRLAILSTDSFTFAATTSGMTAVSVGLNLNTSVDGIRFIGTATSAESINGLDVSSFIRNDINQTTVGSLTIQNDLGLTVQNSVLDGFSISADLTTHVGTISYNSTDRNLKLQVTNGSVGLVSAFFVRADTTHIGVWNESPVYPLDIVGDTRIQGNLTVEGTLTKIESVDLQVTDKNIELSKVTTPTDAIADAGGITLLGTTNHSIYWKNNTTGWNLNDNVNLVRSPVSFTGVTGVSQTGSNATFLVTNNDGNYTVTVQNTGTDYSDQTSLTYWSTTTPYTASWSTTTPYIATWTTGTATYVSVPGYSLTGIGIGVIADIEILDDLTYNVSTSTGSAGILFTATELLVFYGTDLGGTSPANDLIINVLSVDGSGTITAFDGGGTGTWSTSTPYISSWSTSTPFTGIWSTSTPIITLSPTNVITIDGTLLGGTTPYNDLHVTVDSVTAGGSIISTTAVGTATTWVYQISSSTVLTKNSLGSVITSAPGLSVVGVLSYLTVTNVQITSNTIETIGVNETLYLDAVGTGTISVSNNKITELATPTADYDAATKKYVDDVIYNTVQGSFALNLDVTNFIDLFGSIDDGVKYYLDELHPITNTPPDDIFDVPEGSRAKVLCGTQTLETTTATVDVNFATDSADQNGVLNGVQVVSGAGGAGSIAASLPPTTFTPSTSYAVQTWKVTLGVWTKV